MNIYNLKTHLDHLYNDKFKSYELPLRDGFILWQSKKRKFLNRLLGIDKLRIIKSKAKQDINNREFKISIFDLYLSDGSVMPVYFGCTKKCRPPFRPIVIYHGHADGAKTLFGYGMTKKFQNYGEEFMRRGYMVVAPDQRGFGERLGPAPIYYNGYTRSCRQLAFDLMLYGKTILGERVAEGLALVDYLNTRKDLDLDKIIITGNSGGGTVALLQAALDKRVSASIVGSAFCEYKHSILSLSHCECNYIPGLLNYFQEIWEIGALVAPRPLLIIHGKKDKIFSVEYTKKAFKMLQKYYSLSPIKRRVLELRIHSGAHRYDHHGVFDFIDKVYKYEGN